MDQIRKFGEQTSRILEFKPEGQVSIVDVENNLNAKTIGFRGSSWKINSASP